MLIVEHHVMLDKLLAMKHASSGMQQRVSLLRNCDHACTAQGSPPALASQASLTTLEQQARIEDVLLVAIGPRVSATTGSTLFSKASIALPSGPRKGLRWAFEHSATIIDMYRASLIVKVAAMALLLTSASVGWRTCRQHMYQGVLRRYADTLSPPHPHHKPSAVVFW